MSAKLILAVLVCAILSGTSCAGDNSTRVSISAMSHSDAGGTLIAYQVEEISGDHDIHLQKMDADGAVVYDNTLFTSDVAPVHVIGMTGDGKDSIFVAWEGLTHEDGRESARRFGQTTLAKIDVQGQIQWRQGFLAKGRHVIEDGMGGVIMAWTTKEDYYAQRIDSHGNTLWQKRIGGGAGLKLAAAGDGEFFILWDNRDSQSFEVQKISASGELLWGEGGIGIRYTHTSHEQHPQMLGGVFGPIITWAEVTGNRQPSSCVLVAGIEYPHVIWKSTVRRLGSTVHPWTRAVSDGHGGVIVVWEDHRQGMALYAMRKNPIAARLGLSEWPGNGVPVCTDLPLVSPRFEAIENGDAGVVVAWIDGDRRLYAQMLDSSGQRQWGDRGVLIASGVCSLPVRLSGDSKSGFVIGWSTAEEVHSPKESYVQKIDAGGNCLWGEEGIRLNP